LARDVKSYVLDAVICGFDEPIRESFLLAAGARGGAAWGSASEKMSKVKSYAGVALLSVVVNLFLMALKYILGEISGSLALKADAIHSFADVISSVTIFIGILISDRKTKTFPEGLYKVENLVALLSSILILFAAFEIGSDALHAHAVGPLTHLSQAIAGILLIVVVAFAFSRYELRIGLEVGSPSLVADAKHIYTDLLSTAIILVSVLGTSFGYSVDRYVALFVAALVAWTGFQILIDAVKVLLDATLDYQTLDEIRRIMESHPDVTRIVTLGGRSSGRYKSVEVSLQMHTRLLQEAHEIVCHLEEEILDRLPEIDKIVIHYEPQQKETWRVAVPIESADGLKPDENARLSNHFGEAPYFAVLSKNAVTGEVSVETFLKNPFRDEQRHKGVRTAELLADHEIDEVTSRSSLAGKGSGYALEALQVLHSITSADVLPQIRAQLTTES
jgi:cation diffusion facilitator family transporter